MPLGYNTKTIVIVILIVIFIVAISYSKYFYPNQKTFCKGNFTATVERIIDGDTIELNECSEHVRISLVNTPEYYQRGYKEAKKFTSNLCRVGSQAIINQDDLQPYDKYGRIVALVICQNKKLNEELVYNNLGSIVTRFCSTSEFANEHWTNC